MFPRWFFSTWFFPTWFFPVGGGAQVKAMASRLIVSPRFAGELGARARYTAATDCNQRLSATLNVAT